MRISEVASDQIFELITVLQFIKKKLQGNNSEPVVASFDSFLEIVHNSGISLDYETFKAAYDKVPQIQGLIADFNQDTITFGDQAAEPDSHNNEEDPAERVSAMAKRAAKKY